MRLITIKGIRKDGASIEISLMEKDALVYLPKALETLKELKSLDVGI